MASIELEDIIFTGIVTLIAAIQLTRFARSVGKSRQKHKIAYPQMTGDPNFERVLRAQQNSLEFFPIFMVTLWLSSLFFNQVASSVVGLVYIYSRHQYFVGYGSSAQERLPGFKRGVRCLMVMAGMAVAGFVTVLVRMYLDVELGMLLSTALGLKRDAVR